MANGKKPTAAQIKKLRSRQWFDNPDNPDMTALYLERYMNYGLTREELSSGKPIIGIAQSGSDLSPCNRHHLVLAQRVREGIREAGGIAFEFPVHPIQETGKRPDRRARPQPRLSRPRRDPLRLSDRRRGAHHRLRQDHALAADGGRHRRHPGHRAVRRADAQRLVPRRAHGLGHHRLEGAADVRHRRDQLRGVRRAGRLLGALARPLQHHGHGLDHELAGRGARHVAAGLRGHPRARTRSARSIAYETGKRIVDMVWEDLRPSKIMTREAFENVIVVNSAIGGSTNAPIHFNAIARHIGVELDNDDWEKVGYAIPLLVDMQPAGRYLGEEYHRAGGVPAVVNELMKAGKIHEDALTVNGSSIGENCAEPPDRRPRRHPPYKKPLKDKAGFLNLKGNLFDSAIMKTSVISRGVPQALPVEPEGPERLRGPRHRVRRAGGLPQAHRRSRAQDRREAASCSCAARARSAIPAAPRSSTCGRPTTSSRRASRSCPASATAASPAPRARRRSSTPRRRPRPAAGSPSCRTGDRVRIDLNKRTADILISKEEYDRRRADLQGHGGYQVSRSTRRPGRRSSAASSTSSRNGMVLKPAVKYQKIAKTKGIPRDNH